MKILHSGLFLVLVLILCRGSLIFFNSMTCPFSTMILEMSFFVFDQAFSLCASFGLFFRNEKFNGTFVFLISMVKGSSIFVKIVNKFSVLLSYDFLFSMLIVSPEFLFCILFLNVWMKYLTTTSNEEWEKDGTSEQKN